MPVWRRSFRNAAIKTCGRFKVVFVHGRMPVCRLSQNEEPLERTLNYTDYERGYLGHFDPTTRKFEEWSSQSGSGSNPYGIAITDGTVWCSESGVKPNTLVRLDPKTK